MVYSNSFISAYYWLSHGCPRQVHLLWKCIYALNLFPQSYQLFCIFFILNCIILFKRASMIYDPDFCILLTSHILGTRIPSESWSHPTLPKICFAWNASLFLSCWSPGLKLRVYMRRVHMKGSMCNAPTTSSRPAVNGIWLLINTPDHKLLPKLPVISGLKKYFFVTKLYENHYICLVDIQMLIRSF